MPCPSEKSDVPVFKQCIVEEIGIFLIGIL
jgi:hypothetical protein